ncbi:hypothetical protein FPV16_11165 [Methylobacterium sp. W2]|uniref:hypothetical protein n=1 Tax=Methylobacterium sp. W2 TaxID=2598107 RepID=UPI001D0C3D39|nr:hypothetical protein [Methylobacterium sp. W2]MCC0806777.1 hypothetical protein [Methylobacterium sp. W2]
MSASALTGQDRRPTALARLRADDPVLTAFGLACLLTGAVTLALPLIDGRLIDGAFVWTKPGKFFVSVGVYALTFAWFTGYVRPDHRHSRSLRTGRLLLVVAGGFELGYITLQAARAEASHFNDGDPLHAILYAFMGILALTLLAAKIPLAIAVAVRPLPGLEPSLRLAVVLGLAMTVILGAATGIALSANRSHAVGPIGAAWPLLGWNRAGGDLRIAHFLGMHGEQILPLVAAGFMALGWPRRRALVTLVACLLCGLIATAWIQAGRGLAFPFG